MRMEAMVNNHKKPMHKHRPRSNGVSLKMRLAASKNVRTRTKGQEAVSLSKEPWAKKRAPQ